MNLVLIALIMLILSAPACGQQTAEEVVLKGIAQ
jgi:hypothetical protein